jgi:hypothetical protein
MHLGPLLAFCLDPSAKDAVARKYESMYTIVIDDGQFQIAVERGDGYWFPLHMKLSAVTKSPI